MSATIDAMRVARVYYGWLVVAALCVTETVTWGIVYFLSVAVGVFAARNEIQGEPSKLGTES